MSSDVASFSFAPMPSSMDVGGSRTRLDVAGKLDVLNSKFDQHCRSIDGRVNDAKALVLKQIPGNMAGKQVLKRQLQSLKSSLLNLGQKEFFSEGGKGMQSSHNEIQQHASQACDHEQLKGRSLSQTHVAMLLSAILSFSEMHDYKVEADRSAAALESAEEDLKDLKKANLQVDHERGTIGRREPDLKWASVVSSKVSGFVMRISPCRRLVLVLSLL